MGVAIDSLRIVEFPDPVLRRRAAEVPAITDEVRQVAGRMVELMREAEGVGLAAPQVGLAWRLFVAEVPENEEEGRTAQGEAPSATTGPVVYVNPVLSAPGGELEPFVEGCLSLPEIRGEVRRPALVTITATGLDGRVFTQRGSGLLARCWQHEVDHLDGVLILDRMSQASRLKNRKKIRDLERGAEG
jgi:peptide deformylase